MTIARHTYGTTPKDVIAAALGEENYPMSLVGDDRDIVIEMVNQGIDSHLEAITSSTFANGPKLECSVSPADMLVLLRRLGESDKEEAMSLRMAILSTLNIEEI